MKYSSVFITSAILVLLGTPLVTSAFSTAELYKYTGEVAADHAGTSLAVGDINGDDMQDIIVGAPDNNDAANNAGAVYLIYGQSSILEGASLSTAVEFRGEAAGDRAGTAVAVGNLNGDKYDDIIIGAPSVNVSETASGAGAVYIVYGKAAVYESKSLSSSTVKLSGVNADEQAGIAVASGGDIDGDGYDDVLIGAPRYRVDEDSGVVGGAYLVYGKSSKLSSKSLSTHVLLKGAGDVGAGNAVAIAPDINGNGYDEVLVGAPGLDTNGSDAGGVYLLYGQANKFTDDTTLTPIAFLGKAAGEQGGTAIAGVGDVNGDSFGDIIIGAPGNDDIGDNSGAAYVIRGASETLSSLTLSDVTASKITGKAAGDGFGTGVAAGQDMNSDGWRDLVIAAPANDDTATDSGTVYVVYGETTLSSGSIVNLMDIVFSGATAADTLTTFVAADLNGDNYYEAIIGAAMANTGAIADNGEIYLGYLAVDADQDGLLSSDGLLFTGEDCNDEDPENLTDQSFYLDADQDGLGNPADYVTGCWAAPPAGYVANSRDTNDNIPNDGVEILYDGVDNDEDTIIDEVNTLKENGAHPYYSIQDPSKKADAARFVERIYGKPGGRVRVRFADNSLYEYTLFSDKTAKNTRVKKYAGQAYFVGVRPDGKQLAFMNAYTGQQMAKVTLSRKVAFNRTGVVVGDLRKDKRWEIVVTSKKEGDVLVSILTMNIEKGVLRLYDAITVQEVDQVDPTKTKIKGNQIQLRSKTKQVLGVLKIKKGYKFRE